MRYFRFILAATPSLLLVAVSSLRGQPAAAKVPPKDFQGADVFRFSVETWPKAMKPATFTVDVKHHSQQLSADKPVWSLRYEPWGLAPRNLLTPCAAWVLKDKGWLIVGHARRVNPATNDEERLEVVAVNGASALVPPIEGIPMELLSPTLPTKKFVSERATVDVRRAEDGDDIIMIAVINVQGRDEVRITQKWRQGECWWREYIRETNGRKDLHARFASVLTRTEASREKALREDHNAFVSWDKRLAVKVTLVKTDPTFADFAGVIKKGTGVTLSLDDSLRDHVPRCGSCSFRDAPAWVLVQFLARQGYHHSRWEESKGGVRLTLPMTMTDEGLKKLVGGEYISSLNLFKSQVTDAGLKELAGLRNIRSLDLANTKITDAGLKELTGLKDLSHLDLEATQVTDKGLYELVVLKRLDYLNLFRTRVTDEAIKELRKALPDCNIVR